MSNTDENTSAATETAETTTDYVAAQRARLGRASRAAVDWMSIHDMLTDVPRPLIAENHHRMPIHPGQEPVAGMGWPDVPLTDTAAAAVLSPATLDRVGRVKASLGDNQTVPSVQDATGDTCGGAA